MKNEKALIFAAAILMIAAAITVIGYSEDSDAASYGTASNPRTSVSLTWANVYNNNYTEIYVVTGSSFSITHTSSYDCWSLTDEQGITIYDGSAWGLTLNSNGDLSGTLSGTGSTDVTYMEHSGGVMVDYHVTIYIVQGSTPAGSYAQTLVLGDWNHLRYRIVNWDYTYDTGWSNPVYSDVVVNVPNSYMIWFRWYCDSEHISDVNGYFVAEYATSLYGTPIDFYKQITSANTFYPSYKPVEITIYNTASIGGAVTAILFGDGTDIGTFVYDVQQGTSDIITFPSNNTVELTADAYYPAEFDRWRIRSGTTSYSNPYNYSLGATNIIVDTYWTTQPFTVNFNANGGTVSPTSTNVYYGSNYGTLPVPTRQGYGFDGWYTAETGGTQVTANTPVPYTSSGTITLYAHWTANSYTVTFDAATNQGYPATQTKSVQYGSTYGTLPTASRAGGYTFNGWYTAATGGSKVTSSTSVPYSSTGTITLYAQFTLQTYTVTISAGSGGYVTVYQNNNPSNTATAQAGGTASITVPHDSNVTATAYPNSGYHFQSWTYNGNITVDTNPYSGPAIQRNTTYAATFGAGSEYTVTFDYATNGGTGVTYPSKTVIDGQPYGDLPVAIKQGTEFKGWYTTATGGTKILPTDTVDLDDDQTLYAQFTLGPLTVTVSTNNGTVTVTDGSQTISVTPSTSPATMTTSAETVTVTGTAGQGYQFNYWNYFWNGDTETPGGYENDNPWELTLMGNVEIFGIFSETLISKPYYGYVNSSELGTISDGVNTGSYLTGNIHVGDVITISSNVLTIGDLTITATPTGQNQFGHWSGVTNGQVVQNSDSNITFTAYFISPSDSQVVYWSNDLYNGAVTLACRFTGGNSNAVHQINVPLYSATMTGTNPEWNLTNYSVSIQVSYPQTELTVTLLNNGTPVAGYPITKTIGKWPGFELEIDADKGRLNFTPMDRFNNFTSYTTFSAREQTIADWSDRTSGNAIYELMHSDSGNGAPMSFQVINTITFLDTFGVVMTDPSINVHDYFPDYEQVRLNFYSFALYGDSMTVNGKTFPVTEGSVTFSYYTTRDRVNHWVASAADVPEGYDLRTKTLTLSNIYVTWDGTTCSLTFVNDKFTVELGIYSAGYETVSFTGFWYFTTTLYEPVTVTEKSIDGNWKALPDIGGPAMILLYLGALLGLGLIAHVKLGLKWLDLTILAIGLVLGFALLG